MIDGKIQEELISIKQIHQKNVIFVIIGILKILLLKYEPYLCNGCHDLIQKAMNFNDIAIVSIKESDYWIHVWYMSKNDTINIMNNSNLNDKSGVL